MVYDCETSGPPSSRQTIMRAQHFSMKTFKLYLGGSGHVRTYEITLDPTYRIVVEMVQQLRMHLLSDQALCQPLLHLFESVYEDNSDFPQHLKADTPTADQVSNQVKIWVIRPHQPCDSDVIEFLMDACPHLHLELNSFCEGDVLWGETITGRESANKEEVTSINVCLIQLE